MADLALAFDILARDKASAELEKVGKGSKRAADDVEKSSKRMKDDYGKVGKSAEDAGDKGGPKFAGTLKVGMAAAVAAVAAGVAAIGAEFGKALDADTATAKLTAGLGLSEKESKRAGGIAGRLYAQAYGDSMGEVTGAVEAVMSSIDGAGKLPTSDLEKLTANALDFSNVFGVDVTRAAQVAGQAVKTGLADNAAEAFDLLTAASQKVPVALREDILDAADEYGPMFAQLGISGEEAFAALVAGADQGQYGIDKTGDALKEFTIRATDMSASSVDAFDKIGLNADDMAGKILAGGDKANGAMKDIVDGLLGMEDPAEQANAAIALFGTPLEDLGTEGIPGFLESLSGGTEGLGDFDGAAAKAGDTVNDNLSTKVTALKRNVEERLQPAMEGLVTFFSDKALPGIDNLTEAWENGEGPMGDIRDLFDQVAEVVEEDVYPALQDAAEFIKTEVAPVIEDLGKRVVKPIFEGIIIPAFKGLWWIIKNVVGPVIAWLWEKSFKPMFTKMGDVVTGFSENWKSVWNGIQQAAARPINFVIGTIWNDGLRKVFNIVRGVLGMDDLPKLNTVSWGSSGGGGGGKPVAMYAQGGYVDLPWSASDRDPYLGSTPRGMFRFEGEEFIFPRSMTKKHRRSFEAMLSGDMEIPAYANGGTVRPVPQGSSGWNGGYYRSGGWHGGLDFPAPTGQPISAMWDGVVARALRLNRSYGYHAVVDHGDGYQTLYAHMSRLFATAGRTVSAGDILGNVGSTGNSTGSHLHLEVRHNGKQINPDPFLTGAMAGPERSARLRELPGLLWDLAKNIGSMAGGWAGDLKAAFTGVLDDTKDWIAEQIGLPVGGYAMGTNYAAPGLAWVGEDGPELVRFRGGEQVIPAPQSGAGVTQNITLSVPRDAFRDVETFMRWISDLEHRAAMA